MPASASSVASGSHECRSVLHMCSSNTAGPGLAAAKYVPFSATPSDAGIVTSRDAGAATAARAIMHSVRDSTAGAVSRRVMSLLSSERAKFFRPVEDEIQARRTRLRRRPNQQEALVVRRD